MRQGSLGNRAGGPGGDLFEMRSVYFFRVGVVIAGLIVGRGDSKFLSVEVEYLVIAMRTRKPDWWGRFSDR